MFNLSLDKTTTRVRKKEKYTKRNKKKRLIVFSFFLTQRLSLQSASTFSKKKKKMQYRMIVLDLVGRLVVLHCSEIDPHPWIRRICVTLRWYTHRWRKKMWGCL